jgi:hypothetical protein
MLEGWRPAHEWVEKEQRVFPNLTAWAWFVKDHRAELIASEQFIPARGRRATLVGPDIGAVVLRILLAGG